MDILALIIAIIALILAAIAFVRTRGVDAVMRQAEQARARTANALGQVEDLVRPGGGGTQESPSEKREGE